MNLIALRVACQPSVALPVISRQILSWRRRDPGKGLPRSGGWNGLRINWPLILL